VNAIFYLLRTGCQWRVLPREFPPWPTVYYYFRRWEQESVWLTLLRSLYPLTRLKSGRRATPSVAIMDGQSVKTTEKGAFGVLTPIKRIRGRKRHIMVDTLGIPIASRVEAANMSDRRAAARLLGSLGQSFRRSKRSSRMPVTKAASSQGSSKPRATSFESLNAVSGRSRLWVSPGSSNAPSLGSDDTVG
jgi:transposase